MEQIANAVSEADSIYVRSNYEPVSAEHAAWVGRALPAPTYRTPDGVEWVPRDWLRLVHDAGGYAEVEGLFARRYLAAATALAEPAALEDAWGSYLAGLYGACLRDVIPEMIVAKARLVTRLDRALAAPDPECAVWRAALRADVEALDGISRPFAACDRVRFGRATSRDRLITGVRARFPEVFAAAEQRGAFVQPAEVRRTSNVA